ncbi:MAG: GntR family transcriptional regulator [Spirochaetales bacterium]|nr:GntR family transcriptional regulator [Spirochaetales bacterium]
MSDTPSSQPMYRTIFEELEGKIRRGEYPVGSRLPSEKELAEAYRVSRITSRKSLSLLSEAGLAERLPGKGTFVKISSDAAPGRIHSGTAGTVTIGLVIAGFADSFGVELLNGVLNQCREYGYAMILARSDDQADEEERAVRKMLDQGVRGLIVDPAHGEFYNNVFLDLVSNDFPLVFVDRHLEGLKASYVGTDNVQAAFELTDYLFSLGHEQPGFVSFNPKGTSAIEERLAGFVKAHSARGISPDTGRLETELASNVNFGARKKQEFLLHDLERIREFLKRNRTMTAVVADELDAAYLIEQAARELGVAIPGDLSVVTFDNVRCPMAKPSLTHMKQKELEMGIRAVEILRDRINGSDEVVKEYLKAELVPGGSTGFLKNKS